MTPNELQFYDHQLGMVRAARTGTLADWREHLEAMTVLRARIGPVYSPYPQPCRALVKAAYNALREDRDYADFGAVMSCVRGEYRDAPIDPDRSTT